MYKLPPEQVPDLFFCDRTLYRKLLSGPFKEVTFVQGGKLLAVLNGERLAGPDIAWCLQYGNWPKYPLVQLDGNPLNCSMDNIYPARVKRLRYRSRVKSGLHYHPLSTTGFHSAELCRNNWATYARAHYMRDLQYVLDEEAEERKLRAASAPAPAPAREVERAPRARSAVIRPARPTAVEGMEWHWWEGEWLSVPQAVHVSDDYMLRCRKWKAGAVRFVYQPLHGETWGFRADGSVVL